MSDAGRKSVTDQVSDKVTPDSQKSTATKLGETASGVYDRAAGAMQPDSQKSTTQKAADGMRSGSDDASNQQKGLAQSVTDSVNYAAQSVKETLGGNTNQPKRA